MLVGLMSDTHDRIPAIAELLRQMTDRGVGMVLHAGDFCSPFALKPFQDANVALAGVFGRNDGDPEGLKAFAEQGMGHELFESPHSLTIGEHKILLVHDIGDVAARSINAHNAVHEDARRLADHQPRRGVRLDQRSADGRRARSGYEARGVLEAL